jgi:hypothetical protein
MKSLHLKCLGRRKMVMEKVNLKQHICQRWWALTLKKYITKFDDDDDTMVVLSSVDSEVYRIKQKGKK